MGSYNYATKKSKGQMEKKEKKKKKSLRLLAFSATSYLIKKYIVHESYFMDIDLYL